MGGLVHCCAEGVCADGGRGGFEAVVEGFAFLGKFFLVGDDAGEFTEEEFLFVFFFFGAVHELFGVAFSLGLADGVVFGHLFVGVEFGGGHARKRVVQDHGYSGDIVVTSFHLFLSPRLRLQSDGHSILVCVWLLAWVILVSI